MRTKAVELILGVIAFFILMGCIYTVVSYFRESTSSREATKSASSKVGVPLFLATLAERNKQKENKRLYAQIAAQEDIPPIKKAYFLEQFSTHRK